MNKVFYIQDLWKSIFIPFILPKGYRIDELRSVCIHFSKLFIQLDKIHITVPSNKYPSFDSAYLSIEKYINNNIEKDSQSPPPEIWFKNGNYKHNLEKITIPITIRGCGKNTTIIENSLVFRINSCYSNYKSKIYDIGVTAEIDVSRNKWGNKIKQHGIECWNDSKMNIYSCKIFNCYGNGICSKDSNTNIYNSEICNNHDTGIHIWGDTVFKFKNIYIHHNKVGILMGSVKKSDNCIMNNIVCQYNCGTGISLGGWETNNVYISGMKTDISYNNIDKSKHSAGISYGIWGNGNIILDGLKKNISHDNYNNRDWYFPGKTILSHVNI